jgi:hypothetical protein
VDRYCVGTLQRNGMVGRHGFLRRSTEPTLSLGCWLLDAGCWLMADGCWTLGCWVVGKYPAVWAPSSQMCDVLCGDDV